VQRKGEAVGGQSAVATFLVPESSLRFDGPLFPDGVRGVCLDSLTVTGESLLMRVSVDGEDAETVERHVEACRGAAVEGRFDRVGGRTLLDVSLRCRGEGFFARLAAAEVAVLYAERSGSEWCFELLFPSYGAVSSFYRSCTDDGIDVSPRTVHDPDDANDAGNYGLTPGQRETLLVALEAGYFDVPRETDLRALGERLGVSDSAVSQRLRRGTKSLVDRALHQDGRTERR
jgi:predicted DNA binding protein